MKHIFHKNKKLFSALSVALVVVVVFIAGIYLGYENRPAVSKITSVFNTTPVLATTTDPVDFEPFWKVWNLLDEKNPDASKTSAQDRVYGAIAGMVSSLGDPYTTFFDPKENKAFTESIQGEFSGVGMEIGIKDNILTVISALKDSPAQKAGIKAGDKVLKIDKTLTSDLSIDQAIALIRGEKGTTVKLTIAREGDSAPREFSIVRDTIQIPTIDTKLRDDGVFVISLYNFSQNSPQLFRDALKEFANTNSNKLVIDLRGNPGGFLDAAIDMASWFLPSGDVVVSEDFGSKQDSTVHRSKGYDVFTSDLKLAILIDSGSASASEILAGALHDNGKAILVGETSYGKGSVQELVPVTKDTSLKVTIAKWLTPKGASISEHGIIPDYVVPFTEKDAKASSDPQLAKAVQLLLK